MPLKINSCAVTVIRDGRRFKVQPSGVPFDFTEEEVASVIAAGGSMVDAPDKAAKAKVIESKPIEQAGDQKPETKPKPKRKQAAEDDEDGEDF
jgi:hypothetical protein